MSFRAITRPGDVVAVESPSYFGILQNIQSLGLRALEIPAHPRHGLDVDAFEEALRNQPVRAIVLAPTISNPLGSVMPDDQRERLVKLCKRADVAIIEDDVYGELMFDGSRPRPLRAFAPDDSHVILVGSVSKTLAPGYRVGWVAGGRWHDQIVRMKYGQSLACPALLGMAVAEFLASGGYDRHLRRLRAALETNVERYREAIMAEFPEGTRVSAPRGGFVLWVELPRARRRAGAPPADVAPRHRDRAGAAVLGAPAVSQLRADLGGLAVVGADRERLAYGREARALITSTCRHRRRWCGR